MTPLFAQQTNRFPAAWGPPPRIETRDYRKLPGDYGFGSSTLARWIQEHYLVNGEQETTSYYGVLNVPALNVGFHNEHHDFPSVPWNRLPSVRKSAPEAYDTLFHHRSWTRLLLRFLFDRNLSLWSRVVRAERGGVIAAALPVAP